MPSPSEILVELKKVKYPGFTRDIVSFGLIKDIEVASSGVTVTLTAASAKPEVVAEIVAAVDRTVAAMDGVPAVERASWRKPAPARAAAAALHRRLDAGRPPRNRGRQRQGRRRQVDGRGQSRARDGVARLARRPDRRRRLRPERRDDGRVRTSSVRAYASSAGSSRSKASASATSRWRCSSTTRRRSSGAARW